MRPNRERLKARRIDTQGKRWGFEICVWWLFRAYATYTGNSGARRVCGCGDDLPRVYEARETESMKERRRKKSAKPVAPEHLNSGCKKQKHQSSPRAVPLRVVSLTRYSAHPVSSIVHRRAIRRPSHRSPGGFSGPPQQSPSHFL